MKNELMHRYNVSLGESVQVEDHQGFISNGGYYIAYDTEHQTDDYLFEQRSLLEYISAQSAIPVAVPITSVDGQIRVTIDDRIISLCLLSTSNNHHYTNQSSFLLDLHQIGINYPYEPIHASSYGKWRKLWINKTNGIERLYEPQSKVRPATSFQRLFIETLPYTIGLCENALQYLEESEKDWRYHNQDRPTLTYNRIESDSYKKVIFPNDITMDHSTRDLAEHIRGIFINQGTSGFQEVKSFLDAYEAKSPLSIFSWRLLFARLLFPIHILDEIESCMLNQDTGLTGARNLHQLLKNQQEYEQCLKRFHKEIEFDCKRYNVPVLDW